MNEYYNRGLSLKNGDIQEVNGKQKLGMTIIKKIQSSFKNYIVLHSFIDNFGQFY